MDHYAIVGAGFSGAVLARELVSGHDGCRVTVFDARNHIAGNCHTERDPSTGIMVHRYGPHIFHTSRADVWQYVNRFGEFGPYVNRVKASTSRGVYSLPINLHTINQFFGRTMNPREAEAFLGTIADKSIREPANFEEQALRFIGRDLYEAFFRGYTKKQWGCDPSVLPASILKRLPIRFNYNDSYYDSAYQGIPREGYTEMIRRMLDHPRICVELGTHCARADLLQYAHAFYTGPIDALYDFAEGRLGYRTVVWDTQKTDGDFQGTAVINYTEEQVPHTRVHEHKHFAPWEKHDETLVFTEFSKETAEGDIPYYPKRLAGDLDRFELYRALAAGEERISFLGRLATYRYLDMHVVIGEALDFATAFLRWRNDPSQPKPSLLS